MVKKFAVGMIGVTAVLIACEAAAQDFVIEETTVAGIQQALQTNAMTGRHIVQAYLDRIAAYDHKGPAFNSVLTLNPKALAEGTGSTPTERLEPEDRSIVCRWCSRTTTTPPICRPQVARRRLPECSHRRMPSWSPSFVRLARLSSASPTCTNSRYQARQ